MKRYRFERRGHLALAAAAWGTEFDATPPPPPAQHGSVAVVTIRGPLTHHADWWFDCYDAIKERAAAAFASPAARVVLHIDSPGGDVSGCFETARELRAMSQASGKPLDAYIDGMGASGGYALACAADQIYAAAESLIGSIGVISGLMSFVEANQRSGVAFEVITSGARKADGNPNVPITDEARAAVQTIVDDLAELFFAHVSARRGLSVEQVRGFQAAMFHGPKALKAGLVDGVASFGQFLAMVASGEVGGGAAQEDRVDYKELVEALRALAEGEDEEKAAKAKKALAALEGEEEEKPKDDEGPKSEKAEGEDGEKEKEKAEGEEKAKASAKAPAPRAAAESGDASLAAENVRLAQENADLKARALLASRPDLPEATRAWLSKQSAAVINSFLADTAKAPPARNKKPTQGKSVGAQLEGREREEMDAQMGLAPKAEPRSEGAFSMTYKKPSEIRAARTAAARNGGDA